MRTSGIEAKDRGVTNPLEKYRSHGLVGREIPGVDLVRNDRKSLGKSANRECRQRCNADVALRTTGRFGLPARFWRLRRTSPWIDESCQTDPSRDRPTKKPITPDAIAKNRLRRAGIASSVSAVDTAAFDDVGVPDSALFGLLMATLLRFE